MTPYQRHNLKWVLPIILIRLPIAIILQTLIWLGDLADYLADHLERVIPGFKRDHRKTKKKNPESP